MLKRFISILLAALLAFSLAVSASAASFTDLETHWAKSYMEDLAERGYLQGYEDGTMRPENKITTCEALVFLSRFFKTDDAELALIKEDYYDFVSENIHSSLSWAYDNICICLAAGIVSEDQLRTLGLTTPIEKEVLAVFLIRAMQEETTAEAMNGTELTFDDSDDITDSYRGHVAALVSFGIIEGDNKNNFSPHLTVSRAVVATMVERALEYLDKNGKTPEISGYAESADFTGLITSVGSSYFVLTDTSGISRKFSTASASVTVNGSAAALTSDCVGYWATVLRRDGVVTKVSATSESDTSYVQGVITSVGTSTSGGITSSRYIYVAAPDSGTATRYTMTSDTVYYVAGTETSFSGLSGNQFVTIKLADNAPAVIYANTCDYELTGTITTLTYGTSVDFEVTDESGSVYCYTLDIGDLPTVMRGSAAISIDRLSVGDEVTLTVKSAVLTTISVAGKTDSISGTLTSIITTLSGTSWTITDASGDAHTFPVEDSAAAYSGSASILLSDVKIGDSVSVVTFGGSITEVHVNGSASTATKIAGQALNINTSSRQITLLIDSRLVYVNASSASYIIDVSTGKSLALSSLSAGSYITVYGEYTSSSEFKAATILVGAS